MTPADTARLLLLGAMWGASYLFMRLGAGEFGALPLAALRAALAALPMLAWLAASGQLDALRRHWKPIALIGLANSALPYACFGYAAQSLEAGLASIFAAATPLMSALLAWAWLDERPGTRRLAGLVIGLLGVIALAWQHAGARDGSEGTQLALAIGACLLAPLAYAFAGCLAQRRLQAVPPLAAATGGQLAAAVTLALPAAWTWPAQAPSAGAWASAAALALACTAFAYPLFFGLIHRAGQARAATVTLLIPLFALAWGALFLGERIQPDWLLGGALILGGTALALRAARPAPAAGCDARHHAPQRA
ncbi:DMT family transporter [Aquincola sp. S2]|uniref:DMT family transporter n=1 Tax=Pseudaquabacterium terrae TaxID=2732868 RepID=A0ABX2EBM3_9BURK|nr:DMT family transporter [Aquabacterium terrae]NRF66172.1 DMT family transporter [Aquabacterium terrae]